jgi:hypothetical protein
MAHSHYTLKKGGKSRVFLPGIALFAFKRRFWKILKREKQPTIGFEPAFASFFANAMEDRQATADEFYL